VSEGIIPAAANFAAAVREVGRSPRVVVMSMGPAFPDSPSPLGRAQWLAEEILSWAGLTLLVLRVTALFHENLAILHARSIRERDLFRNSFGDVPATWISGRDVSDLVHVALLHQERFSDDVVQFVGGSEMFSHAELAGILSTELGRSVRFDGVSRQEWREDILSLASAAPDGPVNAGMADHISVIGEAVARQGGPTEGADPGELERLIGHRPRTLAEFVREQRQLFEPVRGAAGA
jgi:uncharacterized protein YbjT (DUF2867 family)